MVTPIFLCALQSRPGKWLTFWGYDNPEDEAVHLKIGPGNEFDGATADDEEQPFAFQPGRHDYVFAVVTDGQAVTWNLDGNSATTDYNVSCPEDTAVKPLHVVIERNNQIQTWDLRDPRKPKMLTLTKLPADFLNDASKFTDNRIIRHTDEPNTDLPGLPHWLRRCAFCRMTGGYVQSHGDDGAVSKYNDRPQEYNDVLQLGYKVPDVSGPGDGTVSNFSAEGDGDANPVNPPCDFCVGTQPAAVVSILAGSGSPGCDSGAGTYSFETASSGGGTCTWEWRANEVLPTEFDRLTLTYNEITGAWRVVIERLQDSGGCLLAVWGDSGNTVTDDLQCVGSTLSGFLDAPGVDNGGTCALECSTGGYTYRVTFG